MLRFNLLAFWICVLPSLALAVSASEIQAQITIQLSTEPTNVVGDTVTLGDVATIECDSPAKAARLGKIDIEKFSGNHDSISISSQQILIRIQLAGHRITERDMTGAGYVVVRRLVAGGLQNDIQRAIQQQIVSQYGVPSQDLQVTVDPRFKNAAAVNSFSSISVEPWLHPDLPLGRQSVSINAIVANQSRNISVPVTIAVIREMAVASREITGGTKLTEAHVRSVRRPISSKANRYLTLEQAIGKIAKGNIEKYGLITPSVVRATTAQDQVVIRRNALINVIAEYKGLSVMLRDVKAVSDGRKGGYVQFENPETGERRSARVINATTAKIY